MFQRMEISNMEGEYKQLVRVILKLKKATEGLKEILESIAFSCSVILLVVFHHISVIKLKTYSIINTTPPIF